MTLVASDGGNKTSSVPLVVKITDVNDERPRFSQQVYYANVSENAARGTTVRRVTATDLDLLVLNKEITYTSTGADAKFYINRATGLCMIKPFCNYLLPHVYTKLLKCAIIYFHTLANLIIDVSEIFCHI